MNLEFIRMVLLSVSRRKKSMWKVGLITFLCIFLFTGIMIFQDCMNQFQRENAFLESGEWVVSTIGKSKCLEEHAWVDGYGTTVVRTEIYNRPKDWDMNKARKEGPVGSVDDGFMQLSNLVIYSGGMPEQADEITVTQHALSDMDYSYELGQVLSLAYVKGYNELGEPIYGFVEYKLVGILENYTADWAVAGELPEFFVTAEGLESIRDVEQEDQQRVYYYLNRAQRDINGEGFYRNMKRVLQKQGEDNLLYGMIYNDNAYDVTMWGSQDLYLVMMSLCAILGSMSLIYLFLMCCNHRRPYYFKLRELGASAGQVRGMICLEWCSVFVPSACVGMMTAGVSACLVAAVISKHFKIPFIFRLTGNSVLLILVFTAGVFLLVLFWSCLLFRIKNLYQMTGIIPLRRIKKMYRKGDRQKNPVRLFQIRKRRAEPGKSMAQTLFIIATMTIFLYSLWTIRSAYRIYQESEVRADMYASLRGEGETAISTEIVWDGEKHQLRSNQILKDSSITKGDSIDNGMSEELMQRLRLVPGVKRVCGIATDDQVGLVWNGMKESGFLRDLFIKEWVERDMKTVVDIMYDSEGYPEWEEEWHGIYNQVFAEIPDPSQHPEYYAESVVGIARTTERDQLLKKIFGSNFNSRDFWSGKQSVLFQIQSNTEASLVFEDTPYNSPHRKPLQGVLKKNGQNKQYFYGQWGEEYHYRFEENTMKTGDTLQIQHALLSTGDVIKTEVIYCNDRKKYDQLMRNPVISENYELPYDVGGRMDGERGGMQLLTSEKLLKQFAHAAGKDFTYRTVLIDMEKGCDRKQVEASVADILSHNPGKEISFGSCMGEKQRERNRFYRQLVMFGVILLLTGSVYLFITRSMQNKYMELNRKQLQQFLQCGCGRGELLRSFAFLRIRECIWALVGVPLCMLILIAAHGMSYWKEVQGGEVEFERAELWKELGNTILDYFNNPFGWILFLVFLGLAVGVGILGQKRYLSQLELMGQKE